MRNGMKRLAGTRQQSEDVWFGNKKEIKDTYALVLTVVRRKRIVSKR
jgi:hypothetical protein